MAIASNYLHEKLWAALRVVPDPEIPVLSLVEMGMIHKVEIEDGNILVEMLPTYVGCPAQELMRVNILKEVKAALESINEVKEITVKYVYDPPWTSDRISEAGREKLRQFGMAPPPRSMGDEETMLVECPFCGSPNTKLENLFGPAACRSILYCNNCKNPFEAFKYV